MHTDSTTDQQPTAEDHRLARTMPCLLPSCRAVPGQLCLDAVTGRRTRESHTVRHLALAAGVEQPISDAAPILDANGNPVPGPHPDGVSLDWYRAWMATRVPAVDCPHYVAASEARAGFTTCERCI